MNIRDFEFKPFDHRNGDFCDTTNLTDFKPGTTLQFLAKLRAKEIAYIIKNKTYGKWGGQWDSDRKTHAWVWIKFEVKEVDGKFVLHTPSQNKISRPMDQMYMVREFINEFR